MANWLTKRLDANQQHYDMLRTSYILRGIDPKINPEKIRTEMRLLQTTLRGLSREFDEAKEQSKYFPEIKRQFSSGGFICRILAAEIEDHLPV
jgi:hypothetical protein